MFLWPGNILIEETNNVIFLCRPSFFAILMCVRAEQQWEYWDKADTFVQWLLSNWDRTDLIICLGVQPDSNFSSQTFPASSGHIFISVSDFCLSSYWLTLELLLNYTAFGTKCIYLVILFMFFSCLDHIVHQNITVGWFVMTFMVARSWILMAFPQIDTCGSQWNVLTTVECNLVQVFVVFVNFSDPLTLSSGQSFNLYNTLPVV